MNRLRSKHAALSPNCGFRGLENTFRSYSIPFSYALRRTVETGPSRSFQPPCSLHTYQLLSRVSFYHTRKSRYHCLDSLFSPRREFVLGFIGDSHGASLVQLHVFSPALRSLSLAYSTGLLSKILNFVSSFPLLEDLVSIVEPYSNDTGKWIPPSTPPGFTGSLHIDGGVPSVTRRLCRLPGGLHFRRIHLSYQDDYTSLVAELVSKRSNTLESLTISRLCDVEGHVGTRIGWWLMVLARHRAYENHSVVGRSVRSSFVDINIRS